MTTNGQLRGSLLTMQVALGKVQDAVFNSDNTPNNVDNRQWWQGAQDAISDAQASIPADSNSPDQGTVSSFNAAKVAYDTFTSTYNEFGTTSFPSFATALYESVQELPSTIGSAVGAVVDTAGNAGFGVIKAFFGSLGIWGWLLLLGVGLAVLTYVFPQWTLAVRGLFYK